MNIEIFYCTAWNYLPRASRVEDEMRESFPAANIKLTPSSGGDFRVLVDEKTIYDKSETQTFPKIFEVTNIIKSLN